MTTIICPKCGAENTTDAMNCKSCRVNLTFALEHPNEIKEALQRERAAVLSSAPISTPGQPQVKEIIVGAFWGGVVGVALAGILAVVAGGNGLLGPQIGVYILSVDSACCACVLPIVVTAGVVVGVRGREIGGPKKGAVLGAITGAIIPATGLILQLGSALLRSMVQPGFELTMLATGLEVFVILTICGLIGGGIVGGIEGAIYRVKG